VSFLADHLFFIVFYALCAFLLLAYFYYATHRRLNRGNHLFLAFLLLASVYVIYAFVSFTFALVSLYV
jgi:amino acid transporter